MKYKVIVKKENKYGTCFDKFKLSIVEQEQLDELVSKFLAADFKTREEILNGKI